MRINLPHPNEFAKIWEEVTGVALNKTVRGIVTDSREVCPGDLYIAISGDRVDGHTFIKDVFKKGAVCALINSEIENADEQLIKVNNSVSTIGKVAKAWRNQFDIPVMGITGSNGKTSTKELLKHMLSAQFNIHATEGNFNTSIGLPLTLLRLTKENTMSILEMGANQPGDIAQLCEIAQPTHGVITNIAPAHLEGFGTIEAVAKTKGELFACLAKGVSFINAADYRVGALEILGDAISFGLTPECDYPADIHHEKDGTITLTVDAEEIPTHSVNLTFSKNVIILKDWSL